MKKLKNEKMKKLKIFVFAFILINQVFAQRTQTMGVLINDTSKVMKGYLMFAPKQNTMTYLINNEGRIMHQWTKSAYAPGQAVYLLSNGNLLRPCLYTSQGGISTGGGEGGRVELYNWNDSLLWYTNYSTPTYVQHHDVKMLPNGNIIMLVVEKKTAAETKAAGFDTTKIQDPDFAKQKCLLPDAVVEIKPVYPSGYTVVWEWHVWDHLIQNHDATKNNYGTPSLHPELVDCAGDHRILPVFWNHMNAIDYNDSLDQIVMSVRGNSELWVIDHSTTTLEASSHSGGKHGKGGDLLYRWGNPLTYGAGTVSNQIYFEQHDVEWIKKDCPGAGDFLCYNNGVNRNYSTIDEMTPPVDASGSYTLTTSSAYAPTSLNWTYVANPPTSMYAPDISGAQRIQNGNTVICVGTSGTLYEVTSSGSVAWKYISPVTNLGRLTQGDSIPHNPIKPFETMNSIFRVYKYPTTYAAFSGKTLVPGDFLEYYTTGISDNGNKVQSLMAFPNPFSDKIYLRNSTGKENCELLNILGEKIWSGIHIEQQDFSNLKSGIYFLKVNNKSSSQTFKLIK